MRLRSAVMMRFCCSKNLFEGLASISFNLSACRSASACSASMSAARPARRSLIQVCGLLLVCSMTRHHLLASLLLGVVLAGACGQYAPPPAVAQDEAILKQITTRTNELGAAIKKLRELGMKDPFIADIEVYHRAAQM